MQTEEIQVIGNMRSTGILHDNHVNRSWMANELGRLKNHLEAALIGCAGLVVLVSTMAFAEHFFAETAFQIQSSPLFRVFRATTALAFPFMLIWLGRKKRTEVNVRRLMEKFENALRLLGDQDISTRIVAIQSLGNLLDGKLIRKGGWSVEDHNTVIDVLAGYIRTFFGETTPYMRKGNEKSLPPDVEMAIHFLGRRRWNEIAGEINLDFSGVCFQDADLHGVNFRGANCFEARFRGAIFLEADLGGTNFARAFLDDVNFERAVLVGACLNGANLRQAKLNGANLSDADLTGAILSGADLQDANLRRSNLQGACLSGSNLQGALLDGADLTGAYYSRDTHFPDGFDPEKNGMSISNF